MPWSGPRIRPAARSRSRSSARSSAFGFTVIAAWRRSSYVPMRTRYCCTIWREVVRPCSSAARISGIVASTTVNGLRGAAALRSFCARTAAMAATVTSTAATGSSRFIAGDYRHLRPRESPPPSRPEPPSPGEPPSPAEPPSPPFRRGETSRLRSRASQGIRTGPSSMIRFRPLIRSARLDHFHCSARSTRPAANGLASMYRRSDR